jgi:hypothetical protein
VSFAGKKIMGSSMPPDPISVIIVALAASKAGLPADSKSPTDYHDASWHQDHSSAHMDQREDEPTQQSLPQIGRTPKARARACRALAAARELRRMRLPPPRRRLAPKD